MFLLIFHLLLPFFFQIVTSMVFSIFAALSVIPVLIIATAGEFINYFQIIIFLSAI